MVAAAPDAAGLEGLQARLGHVFTDATLLLQALTHSGAMQGRGRGLESNERMEFIGDRVLGLVIAEWLLERFPEEREGGLGRRLGHLVSAPSLAIVARAMGLASLLVAAPSDERAGVRQRDGVLADAAEALLGAVYLDGGLIPARHVVRRFFAPLLAELADAPQDPKTALQEWTLGRGLGLPSYDVVDASGPAHFPLFRVAVSASGVTEEAEARSKQGAEKAAAAALLARLVERS